MSALESLVLIAQLQYLLPAGLITNCSIYDSVCLTNVAQNNVPSLLEYSKKTEPLDPMYFDYFNVDTGNLEYEGLKPTVRGLKNVFIENVAVNKQDKRFQLKMRIPALSMLYNYTSKGFIQEFSYNGEGEAFLQIYDLNIDMTIDYDIIKGNEDKDVLQLNKYLFWSDIRGHDIVVKNLQDTVNYDEVHNYFRKNSKILWQQYGIPLANRIVGKIFQMLKNVFLSLPMESYVYDY